MPGDFVSSLWSSTGTPQGRLTSLQLTVPPASSGSTFSFSIQTISGMSLGAVSIPSGSGLTWDASTSVLTVDSSFEASQTVILPLTGANVSSTSFSINPSWGDEQSGGQTTITVDANGWMLVTNLGNVTMQGLYYMVKALPGSGGQVQLNDPVVLIPSVSGSPDFSFTFAASFDPNDNDGSLSLSSSNNSLVTVSGNTATATSSLGGQTSSATVTVTYTPNGGGTETVSSFVVQRLTNSPSAANGASSTINLNSDQTFTVTGLAADALLRGTGVNFQTTLAGTYNLIFYTVTPGLQFSPISFTSSNSAFSLADTTGVTMITTTNVSGTSAATNFTVATSLGTLTDPTIINNPDPG